MARRAVRLAPDEIARRAAELRAIFAEGLAENANLSARERELIARCAAQPDNPDAVLVGTFHLVMAIRDGDVSRKRRKAQRVAAAVRGYFSDALLSFYENERAKGTTPGAARKKICKKYGISDTALQSRLKRARARRRARTIR